MFWRELHSRQPQEYNSCGTSGAKKAAADLSISRRCPVSCREDDYIFGVTLLACKPFGPRSTVNSTVWPSASVR